MSKANANPNPPTPPTTGACAHPPHLTGHPSLGSWACCPGETPPRLAAGSLLGGALRPGHGHCTIHCVH
eukprot:1147134-Pelagomonas_calceolata.AAC.3